MTVIYDNKPLERASPYLDGSAYIGVAGSDLVIGSAERSIYQLYRRPGDGDVYFGEGTKGAEVREAHIGRFLESRHDFLLFLDGDMLFPPHLLEQLRSHGLPCVSGHYVRRTFDLILPIWYEDDPTFRWPMMPFRETPQAGHLYRLGATGFGCWLIHRSVFEAVAPLLKGEAFVWQDDMDVWPYDLKEVRAGREPLRVLRGVKDQVGADIRLSFFIRRAGFTLWGDPEAACGHYIHYPLGKRDWDALNPEFRRALARGTDYEMAQVRAQFDAAYSEAIQEGAAES